MEATDILSGYKRVQTFDPTKTYYYKDSNGDFQLYVFEGVTDEEKLDEFANALADDIILYVPTEKAAPAQFNAKIGITTLEEYFNWLPDLKNDLNGKPTKYTILPLDEPHFEINANTRAINIPNDFKKNGIAVQGDDLAEVVYFKVDRYFDAMDLNNTEIYIEWETPKDKTHEAIKGVSDVYIRDIESEPGKLIFGWAISDALTAAAGTLKFSVKFFQRATDENGKVTLAYALNTLTAQVAIQQSIGIDIENDYYEPDNATERLLERIEPGVVVGTVQAEYPYFLEEPNADIEYDIVPNHTDGTLKIYAVATASDTGAISYVWKRRDLDEHNNPGHNRVEVPGGTKTELVEVEKDVDGYPILKEKHIYYYGDTENLWVGDSEAVKAKWNSPELVPPFYERKAVLEVEQYGIYSVEARNRIFNSMSKSDSKTATFKRPEFINIDNTNEASAGHIIGEANATLEPPFDTTPVGDLSYQWSKAAEVLTVADDYKFVDLPINSEVSYGGQGVRIMVPATADYQHQNPDVNNGGNVNYYYMTMVCYVPDGAVSFREGDNGQLDDELLLISERTTGTDELGFYRKRWLPIAGYDENTKTWTYYGSKSDKTKYIGWDYVVEWYDENNNLIKSDSLRIDLSNENCHVDLQEFEPFEEIIDGVDLAKQKAYTVTEPGLYQVTITRTRNRGFISEKSLAYRVTNPPLTPEFVDGTYANPIFVYIKELEAGSKVLEVILKDNIDSDEYYVTWNLYRGDRENLEDLPIITQKISGNSSQFNPADEAYADIFANAGEDIEGLYYATVTNKLNGVMSAPTEVPASAYMFVVTGQ